MIEQGNKYAVKLLGIEFFHKAGFKGQGQKIFIHEVKNEQHKKWIENLAKQIAPKAELIFNYGSTLEGSIKYCVDNDIPFMNASLRGIRIKDTDAYEQFKKKTLFFAAAGNTRTEGKYYYPASHDDTISVAYGKLLGSIIKQSSNSAENNKIDHLQIGSWWVNGTRQEGSSFACITSCMMMALYASAFVGLHGRQPTKPECINYMQSCYKDLGDRGYDTKYGHGDFKLKQNFNKLWVIWSSKQKKYINKADWLNYCASK